VKYYARLMIYQIRIDTVIKKLSALEMYDKNELEAENLEFDRWKMEKQLGYC